MFVYLLYGSGPDGVMSVWSTLELAEQEKQRILARHPTLRMWIVTYAVDSGDILED